MTMTEFVEMTYPHSGGKADFPAGAVEAWRARGWIPTAELQPVPGDSTATAATSTLDDAQPTFKPTKPAGKTSASDKTEE